MWVDWDGDEGELRWEYGLGLGCGWTGVGLSDEGGLGWDGGWGLRATSFSVLQTSYSVSYL